jgi:hypothetical protein
MNLMTPAQFIRSAPWRFAKTMPDQPHEYTLRGETPDGDFNRFVQHIREHGYRAEYGGRFYTYLEVDAWRYWTMGAPVESTTVINMHPAPPETYNDEAAEEWRVTFLPRRPKP